MGKKEGDEREGKKKSKNFSVWRYLSLGKFFVVYVDLGFSLGELIIWEKKRKGVGFIILLWIGVD